MKTKHPNDFNKYGNNIADIISSPTYLARNEKKKSIEFIKEFKIDNDFVLIAVRVSGSVSGSYFARTMYVMSDEKIEKYFKHNYFIKVEKNKKYVIIKLT